MWLTHHSKHYKQWALSCQSNSGFPLQSCNVVVCCPLVGWGSQPNPWPGTQPRLDGHCAEDELLSQRKAGLKKKKTPGDILVQFGSTCASVYGTYVNDQLQRSFRCFDLNWWWSEQHWKGRKLPLHHHTGSWQTPVAWYLSVWSCLQRKNKGQQSNKVDFISVSPRWWLQVKRCTHPWALAVWRNRPRNRQSRFSLLCCSASWWRSELEDWCGSLTGESTLVHFHEHRQIFTQTIKIIWLPLIIITSFFQVSNCDIFVEILDIWWQ